MEIPEIGGSEFQDAGEIVIASDSKARRDRSWVRRTSSGAIELLSKRSGPSGDNWTIREILSGPKWRYRAEGESLAELAANYLKSEAGMFSETLNDSIADVTARHALAAMKEIELSGK